MVFIFFYLKNLNGMRSRSAGGRGTTLGTIIKFLLLLLNFVLYVLHVLHVVLRT